MSLPCFRNAFFKAGAKGASSFTDVALSTFGTMNDVYDVVRQTVELFRDVHLGGPVTLVLVQTKGHVPYFVFDTISHKQLSSRQVILYHTNN